LLLDWLDHRRERWPNTAAGQADVVEPVDHITDGVLIGLANWAMTGTRFPPAGASNIIARR
jgi:hypothetical protein